MGIIHLNTGVVANIYETLDAEYHRISDALRKLFKEADIYVGGIERSPYYGGNDELFDLEIYSNFRVYFSNHEQNLIIPFTLLAKIEEIVGTNFNLYFLQIGARYNKGLYLYLDIDAKEDYLKSLLND